MRYLGIAVTDIGISKQTNQDSACIKVANTKDKGQIAMVVLCDGMGGLAKGELASATVIRTLSNWFERELPQKLNNYSWNELAAEWDKMIKEQNYKILEYGKTIRNNLGTTISAMLIIEEKYMIVHVGDTRVYRISETIEQLTEDQTFIAREIEKGTMTIEEAAKDPRKNMLLQCVGASRTVSPDIIFGDIQPNTVFMLCSDGFRHVLTNEEIYAKFNPNGLNTIVDMKQYSKQLIELVKSRGEKDNITVSLLKCVN